jgi:hypothetical protein
MLNYSVTTARKKGYKLLYIITPQGGLIQYEVNEKKLDKALEALSNNDFNYFSINQNYQISTKELNVETVFKIEEETITHVETGLTFKKESKKFLQNYLDRNLSTNELFNLNEFVKRLEKNPIPHVKETILRFVLQPLGNIFITETGSFIGYKRVNIQKQNSKKEDNAYAFCFLPVKEGYALYEFIKTDPKTFEDTYYSVHSGKNGAIEQFLGEYVYMETKEVNSDPTALCVAGLHVGDSSYSFSGHVRLFVEVNPEEVIAVPTGYGGKIRTNGYRIVGADSSHNVILTPQKFLETAHIIVTLDKLKKLGNS